MTNSSDPVLEIARERLKNLPGAFEEFQGFYTKGIKHRSGILRQALASFRTWRAMEEAVGNYGDVRKRAIRLIDAWADDYQGEEVEPLAPGEKATKTNRASPPGWTLNKPQRFGGYSRPLYDELCRAHKAGEPYPTAAVILKLWRAHPPQGYGIEVADNLRTFSYHSGGQQAIKTVNAEALTKTIGRQAHKAG